MSAPTPPAGTPALQFPPSVQLALLALLPVHVVAAPEAWGVAIIAAPKTKTIAAAKENPFMVVIDLNISLAALFPARLWFPSRPDYQTIKSRVRSANIICEPNGTVGGRARKIPHQQPGADTKAVP